LQNKANFKNDQMNIKLNISIDYEKKLHWTLGKNKPNQSQFQVRGISLAFFYCIWYAPKT